MIADRWGVSDDEVARPYPCDDLVPAPVLQAWRGVTVRATPEQVGERFTTAATRGLGRILSVTPGEQLTGRIAGTVMTYCLLPHDGRTRLVLKLVAARGRLVAPVLSVGDLVMARRQLLNFKDLVERPTARS